MADNEDDKKRRDWSKLPPDILQEIGGRLPEISDLIRLRSVCVQWRSSPIPKTLPQQFPWILLTPRSDATPDRNAALFWSLSDSRIHSLPLGFPFDWIFALPHGWLIAFSQNKVSLVNPITRASDIPLPSLIDDDDVTFSDASEISCLRSDDTNIIALFFPRLSCILFCCPGGGDTSWSRISLDGPSYYPCSNFIIHNGAFFVLHEYTRETQVYDMITRPKVSSIPPVPDVMTSYLSHHVFVGSPSASGELLLVQRQIDEYETNHFNLFRLDGGDQEQQLKWVNVSSTADYTICMSVRQAVCLDYSTGLKNCRGKCNVYFVDQDEESPCAVSLFRGRECHEERVLSTTDGPWEMWYAEWFIPRLS